MDIGTGDPKDRRFGLNRVPLQFCLLAPLPEHFSITGFPVYSAVGLKAELASKSQMLKDGKSGTVVLQLLDSSSCHVVPGTTIQQVSLDYVDAEQARFQIEMGVLEYLHANGWSLLQHTDKNLLPVLEAPEAPTEPTDPDAPTPAQVEILEKEPPTEPLPVLPPAPSPVLENVE